VYGGDTSFVIAPAESTWVTKYPYELGYEGELVFPDESAVYVSPCSFLSLYLPSFDVSLLPSWFPSFVFPHLSSIHPSCIFLPLLLPSFVPSFLCSFLPVFLS
jgi:hypothetical protein